MSERRLVGGPMADLCACLPGAPDARHMLLVLLEGAWHAYRQSPTGGQLGEPPPLVYAGEVSELPRLAEAGETAP